MNTRQLIDEAACLPVEQQAFVLESLLKSFNNTESDNDSKWVIVANKRLAETRAGTIKVISGDKVFEKTWSRFS